MKRSSKLPMTGPTFAARSGLLHTTTQLQAAVAVALRRLEDLDLVLFYRDVHLVWLNDALLGIYSRHELAQARLDAYRAEHPTPTWKRSPSGRWSNTDGVARLEIVVKPIEGGPPSLTTDRVVNRKHVH